MKSYPIIDIHMHAFQWNKYGDPPPSNLITGKRPTARSNTEAIEAYIAEMDRYNIVLAVGSGELEMVKEMKAHVLNRFIGGIEFPKYTSPVNKRMEKWPSLNELRILYESGLLKIMGEITAQYAGVAPNDPKLEKELSRLLFNRRRKRVDSRGLYRRDKRVHASVGHSSL